MLRFLKTLPLKIALGVFCGRASTNSFHIHCLLYEKKYKEAAETLRAIWLLDPEDRAKYELVLDRMWRAD